MDQGIKRAVFITVIVVVVAKLASAGYDAFTGAADDEMLANQQAFKTSVQEQASSQYRAENAARIAENCHRYMQRDDCASPKNFSRVNTCLRGLRERECESLPRVHLCAAVEELQACSDEFADQSKNGCNRLRRTANCKRNPVPDDREDLWSIDLDDGMWDGES